LTNTQVWVCRILFQHDEKWTPHWHAFIS